jgi:Na+/proline symporter
MMSRFTKANLWGILLFPIGITILISNFKIRLFAHTWQMTAEKAWDTAAYGCFWIGALCLLATPFCLIQDIAEGKRRRR